jgi:hypothetical protein
MQLLGAQDVRIAATTLAISAGLRFGIWRKGKLAIVAFLLTVLAFPIFCSLFFQTSILIMGV